MNWKSVVVEEQIKRLLSREVRGENGDCDDADGARVIQRWTTLDRPLLPLVASTCIGTSE